MSERTNLFTHLMVL